MTFDEFVKTYNGKAIDYDGTASVQCVDLMKLYTDKVLGVKLGACGNAHAYWDNFNNLTAVKNTYTRVNNTSSFIPKKGDVAVWSTKQGKYGHIAICDGVGTTSYFYSYDQNWKGKHDAMTRVKHSYKNIAGFLRPNDQTKVLGAISGKSIGSIFIDNTRTTVKVSALRVRKNPNLNATVIKTVKQGEWVNLYSFCYEGTRTWAKTDGGYICVCEDSNVYINVRGKTTANLNYRESPSTGKILGQFPKGTVITTIDKECYGWASCIYNGKRVWFSLAYITKV